MEALAVHAFNHLKKGWLQPAFYNLILPSAEELSLYERLLELSSICFTLEPVEKVVNFYHLQLRMMLFN